MAHKNASFPRLSAIFLTLTSALATLASAGLVLTEIKHYQDPDSALGCDINPLVGCSDSLTTWQGHLFFGVPNALLGTMIYAALTAVFALLAFGLNLPRRIWQLLTAGLSAAMVLVLFFLYHSLVTFKTLCPYCLVVWVCTILLWVHVTAHAHRLGALTSRQPAESAAFLYKERWIIVVICLALFAIAAGIGLMDKLALVL